MGNSKFNNFEDYEENLWFDDDIKFTKAKRQITAYGSKIAHLNTPFLGYNDIELSDLYSFFITHKKHLDKSSHIYYSKIKKIQIAMAKITLKKLTDIEREIVFDVVVNGMKQKDVAQKRGVDNSTISKNLKAAKKHFNDTAEMFEAIKPYLRRFYNE